VRRGFFIYRERGTKGEMIVGGTRVVIVVDARRDDVS